MLVFLLNVVAAVIVVVVVDGVTLTIDVLKISVWPKNNELQSTKNWSKEETGRVADIWFRSKNEFLLNY